MEGILNGDKHGEKTGYLNELYSLYMFIEFCLQNLSGYAVDG
jgi:hypothetical protein